MTLDAGRAAPGAEAGLDLRNYSFLGTTQSLCPSCRRLVPAKIIALGERVYFKKRCPEHGEILDFVCSDRAAYDRNEFSRPARLPRFFGTEAEKGCPYDCGLCPEHEQHTCIALLEVTSSCNLTCPMCFAESAPGGKHLDFETFTRMVDRLVRLEGSPEVLQLSGGEPTIHPEILPMVWYACGKPIAAVMLNTNGIRLAKDPSLAEALAEFRHKVEIYLQFDGFDPATHLGLRGEDLASVKEAALENLRRHDLRVTLVTTVDHNTNLHELGRIVRFGLERPFVRGVSFQLATYCGRHLDPRDLEKRATIPDVEKAIAAQTGGLLRPSDFYPLPCAHPNCHSLTYLYRCGGTAVPISRFVDPRKHLDLISNSIVYTPARARGLIETVLSQNGACGPDGCAAPDPAMVEFAAKALALKLTGKEVFRITLTAFLDAHTFDVRRVMKCCIAHLLPSGHLVPFCAYNTLYRDGFLPLPPLRESPARRGADHG